MGKKERHIRNMEWSIDSSTRIMNDPNRPLYVRNKAKKSLYYYRKQIEITKRLTGR